MGNSNKKTYAPIWFTVALILVILAWGLNWYLLGNTETPGTFGDMFGAVNALFSGFAVAGLVYAVVMQRYEIKIAKEDLRQTKDILNKQQEQLDLQNKATAKQGFENTFFQLLSLFTQLTEKLEIPTGYDSTKVGKDNFVFLASKINAQYKEVFYDWDDYGDETRIKDPVPETDMAPYAEFYQLHSSKLGHYFRTFYNILKFVDKSDIDNKNFYTNLVRAQLSDDEAKVMFFNGLSKHGKKRLKPLLEKYTMLKNAPTSNDYPWELELRKRYAPSAFVA